MDLFLRAETEDEFNSLLQHAGTCQGIDGVNIDVIGTIYQTSIDQDGNTTSSPLPGYHANLRLTGDNQEAISEALSSITISQPFKPVRLWS